VLDIELFRIFSEFSSLEVQPLLGEELVTFEGRGIRSKRDVWLYDVRGVGVTDIEQMSNGRVVLSREYGSFGDVQEDGTFVARPLLYEFPHFTSRTDDALGLKRSVIGSGRQLVVEEIDAEPIPRWRTKIIVSDKSVAEGETYYCASAVVVAILSDLIENEEASWWIDVV
jgi:hypothetical protein